MSQIQAISSASLVCAGRAQRAAAMREPRPATQPAKSNAFQKEMHDWTGRELARGEVLALPALDATLVCLEGELWLTREGDPKDHILGIGGSLHLFRADRAAVQALRSSRMRLIRA